MNLPGVRAQLYKYRGGVRARTPGEFISEVPPEPKNTHRPTYTFTPGIYRRLARSFAVTISLPQFCALLRTFWARAGCYASGSEKVGSEIVSSEKV